MTTNELREVDARVAERVMGWKRTNKPDEFTATDETLIWTCPTTGELKGEAYRVRYAPEGAPFNHQWVKYRPTINAAQALEVLRVILKADNVEISTNDRGEYVIKDPTHRVRVEGETLEIAICLMALRLKD